MEHNPLISDKIVEQILAVRKSGVVNMFDVKGVQHEAHRRQFYELVVLLEEHPKQYVAFILTGNR
ncbi:MAG: DUF5049 domain-containing protein [Saccharofermentanales bacterium]|jgi:hypothetical protein